MANAQAARFSQVCRVYAPMYPQSTLAAIANPSKIGLASAIVAYSAVDNAFRNYMAHYNHGRGIVFIGHSQGAMMLTVLLKYEVDGNPATLRLLVSAILAGGNVTVQVGKNVGGDFANIPACGSTTQVGCVIAYSSFDRTPPSNAVFGRVNSALNPFATTSGVRPRSCASIPRPPAEGRPRWSPTSRPATCPRCWARLRQASRSRRRGSRSRTSTPRTARTPAEPRGCR